MKRSLPKEECECLKRYYPNLEERRAVSMKYAKFPDALGAFADPNSLRVEDLWIRNVDGFFIAHPLQIYKRWP